jgi:hypothetical protein
VEEANKRKEKRDELIVYLLLGPSTPTIIEHI